jgi:DNA invertase Pin-like site-specific DNA recombinase
LLDCLANLRELDSHGARFIATTQALDTDNRNPASKFLLHVLGAAAEFERELIPERSKAALSAGTRLGPYEILAPIGAGGMGEVYRAKDAKLKRAVALKALPEAFANGPERNGRMCCK